jgi:hypothetical protein
MQEREEYKKYMGIVDEFYKKKGIDLRKGTENTSKEGLDVLSERLKKLNLEYLRKFFVEDIKTLAKGETRK